ncbi:hypothetical protein OAT37_00455 [Alphaproteobacteria bacterium]|nr:hypothetical protein [Alphaproteobacteria bacterium]
MKKLQRIAPRKKTNRHIIRIPDPVFPLSGLKPEITPGMPVVVDVLGGKRTVLDYILSPIERAQTIIFREK